MDKPPWQLAQTELEDGRLMLNSCPECHATGRVRWSFGEEIRETDCGCVLRSKVLLDDAGFPERFAMKTLADLHWEDLAPGNLPETIQGYITSLATAWEDGVGLVLFGPAGTGKTHVAVGIGKIICALGYSLVFVTVADWLEALRASYDKEQTGKTTDHQLKQVLEGEWVLLDDLGLESETAWVREKIYQVVNRRWLEKLPTIVTTNRSPEELSLRYGEGVVSRLWGSSLVLHFKGEDYRQKERSTILARFRINHSQPSQTA